MYIISNKSDPLETTFRPLFQPYAAAQHYCIITSISPQP